MIRETAIRAGRGRSLTHDLEALALAVGVLAVILALCLVSAISPGSI